MGFIGKFKKYISGRGHLQGKKIRSDNAPLFKNVAALDLLYKFSFPVLISDLNGYIIWHNETALEYLAQDDGGKSGILKKSVAAVSNNQLSPEKFYKDGKNIRTNSKIAETAPAADILINGRYFKVSMEKIETDNEIFSDRQNFFMFIFEDRTEFEFLKYESEMKEPVAAYFMIDNLDETNQKMQDKYRTVSGAVSDLLGEIVGNCGGLIKEYAKDRYLCFFENKDLKNFMRSKFSILDLIRDIRIEDLNMSVTVSGGISNIPGSLSEKEAAARYALDLALQRGGDQVVVKGLSSTEFFGGRTKTVQKRTKVRSRVIAGDLAEHIKNSSNVIIMGHKYADNDSIGACAGLAKFSMSVSGCEVNIIANIHDPNIKSALARIKWLEAYADIFIDETAALDKIEADTLVIVADVNNPWHFESEAVYKNVYKCVVIDHHRKTVEYVKPPDIEYIEPSASSASELVAEILEQSLSPGELSKEVAELLLAGIFLDTQSFSRNTGPRTHATAVYLQGEGANPEDALSLLKINVEVFTKEALFLSNIFTYRGIIAISAADEDVGIENKTAGAKAADRMLDIEGIAASFVIFKIEGEIHISARSLGKINVQIILEEAFSGGGHFDVAGAQVKNSNLKEVLVILKKTIDEYFEAD